MGLYDEVIAICPKCGNEIAFQSKAGNCAMERFDSRDVPFDIAEDVNGQCEECSVCGNYVSIELGHTTARMIVR